MSTPIPAPPGLPLLGNAFDINTDYPLGSLLALAERYGSSNPRELDLNSMLTKGALGKIYKLSLKGTDRLFISSNDLVNEVCDEKRFEKTVPGGLLELRHLSNDGLFTAFTNEHNWGVAHRTLMPAFGPIDIAGMFEGERTSWASIPKSSN